MAHRAAQGGVDSVQVLLGLEGIRWNEKNDNGDSPVMVAFKYEKYDAVKLLITDVNVDTEIRNNEGNTLEDLARKEGATDILQTFFLLAVFSESCNNGNLEKVKACSWFKCKLSVTQ